MNGIKILHLEDDLLDAELISSTLIQDGLDFERVVVDSRETFVAAFESGAYDLVLADYSLPSFDGLSALKTVRGRDSQMPFILVSGNLGEELAVDALRAGATDYVLKSNLSRLAPVVRRALGEAAAMAERLRAEEELGLSQERLKHIIENSPDLFYSHTPDNLLTYLSPQYVEFLDGDPEEPLTSWTDYATDHPVNMRGIEITQTAIDTGERQDPYELELKTRSGRVVWVEVREAPVVQNGRTVAMVGSLHDITDRKRVAESLQESEERYRDLVEKAGVAIVVDDVEGRLLYFNRHFIGLFGFSETELDGKKIWDFIFPDDLASVGELHHRRLAGDPDVPDSYVTRAVRKNGGIIHLEVVATPLVKNGGIIGTRSYLRDVSERKQLEAELAQMQKLEALGQLAGGIAHDFNNLLMSISGSTELLGFRFAEEESETQELTTIRGAVARGAELTQRLLAVARQQVLEMEITDLRSVITDELRILRRLIPENINIDYRPAYDQPLVMADHGQLSQVLMNLIVNARDAMPRGGTIAISTGSTRIEESDAFQRPGVSPGSYVVLSLADTGLGMDAVTISRIFEPFFTTKANGVGTGMGLATVYGIVKQHNGFLEVESSPGGGTTFEVFLPVTTGSAVKRYRPATPEAVVGNATVLVVEDETIVRKTLVGMLKVLGYSVIETGDGSEALQVLESGAPIDLVITDVVMPVMGGRELLGHARKLKPRVAFLFTSGNPDSTLSEELDNVEQTSFLGKPFTMAALTRAIRRILEGEDD